MYTLLTSLCEVKDIPELKQALLRIGAALGFERAGVFYSRPSQGGRAETHIHNYPSDWLANLPEDAANDPVLARIHACPLPFAWDHRIYEQANMSGFYEAARFHGFHSGIDMAHWYPDGRRIALSFCSDRALNPTELPNQVARLGLASDLISATLTALLDERLDVERQLTSQQRAALGYTLDGHHSGEVADLLGLSDVAVDRITSAAAHALGVGNARQAAMLAARLGLVH
ncbi:autoinducer binding domain-containing protein [Chitinimonas lacunae]|uniref:Autoinducer binding domain-containing protein n=1 Tax=Chitinimonas lacunae TaxID=1963018 RepID=A0ABV8ML15_9NEIS